MHLATQTLQHFLDTFGYLAVFAFVAIESTGIPFPGETMLIVAGAYAGAGHLKIPLVIAAGALGAICGDNSGYWIGRTGGRKLVRKYGHYVRLEEQGLLRAEDFFRRHGDKTVFIGRFITLLRAWNAFLAGLNRMRWRNFVLFDAAGAITWATIYGTLAFELGKNLPLLQRIVSTVGVAGLTLAVLAVLAFFVVRRRRRETAAREERML